MQARLALAPLTQPAGTHPLATARPPAVQIFPASGINHNYQWCVRRPCPSARASAMPCWLRV
jgi:hypothetical protein